MAKTFATLERQLDSYSTQALPLMISARKLKLKSTSKGEKIEALVRDIADQKSTRAAFDQLKDESKLLLRLLREMGGKGTIGALKVAASAVGLTRFDAHFHELLKYALVLYSAPGRVRHELWDTSPAYTSWEADQSYEIEGVEAALALADDSIELPPPAHNLEIYRGEPYHVEEQSPANLLHVLFNVVRWASEREITLTKTTGTLRKADLKALDNLLKDQSELKGFALSLAFKAGLLIQKRERMTPVPRASEFFKLVPREQVGQLFEAWKKMENWSEFFQIPEIEAATNVIERESSRRAGWGYAPNDVPTAENLVGARAYLVSVLKRAGKQSLGQWQSFDSLLTLVKAENAEFLIPLQRQRQRYNYNANGDDYDGFWPVGENRWKSAFARGRDWNLVEGRFLRQLLTEPLHRLGVAAIARDENGAVVAFRISPLGAHLLGLSDEIPDLGAQAEGEKPLIIQPNFEIIAYTEPQHLQTLYQLERFATRERAERVAHYKLDKDSVYRGLQDGMSAPEMREFLETHSRSGVPQNIAYSLDDWQAQWQRVTVWPSASIIEAETPDELDAIIATLGEDAITRLAPNWAVVEPKHLQSARNYLTGSRNAQALDYSLDIEQAFETSDDLEIVVPADNIDLWLRAKLEQFAEFRSEIKGQVRFEITPSSVARAAALGSSADDILAFLETIGTPPVPANVTLTIKGWSGEVAPVSLGGVQVLVADAEVVAQMASVAELRKLLWLRAGDGAALVKSADVPKLKAALKKRGIAFDGQAETHLKAPRASKAEKTQPRRRPANRSVAVDNGVGARIRPLKVAAHPDEDDLELQYGLSESVIETLLESAIEQSRCVVIEYQSKARKALRKISPLEVFGDGGNIYVGAWDHWRKAGRVFRLDRIVRIAVTDDKFDPSRFE